MSDKYYLFCKGKCYNDISLEKAKQILFDEGGYSCAYVDQLVNKANVKYSPPTIEWVPGRNMNWVIDGVRMGRKCALFALEFKGHTKEQAELLLYANKLCQDTEAIIAEVQEVCRNIDEEFRLWLSLRKSGLALSAPTAARSVGKSSRKINSEAGTPLGDTPAKS